MRIFRVFNLPCGMQSRLASIIELLLYKNSYHKKCYFFRKLFTFSIGYKIKALKSNISFSVLNKNLTLFLLSVDTREAEGKTGARVQTFPRRRPRKRRFTELRRFLCHMHKEIRSLLS